MKMNKILNYILGTLLALSLIFILFQHLNAPDVTRMPPVIKYDTIVEVKYDTITKEKIKYKERIKLDTLYLHDTIFIKEQINYRDSIASIWVSGYHPEIDSIHYTIPEKTIYVDKIVEVQKKESFWKNRFVITAGFSTQYGLVHKQWDVGPYVGIGVRIF
jgi:hypothetical protein